MHIVQNMAEALRESAEDAVGLAMTGVVVVIVVVITVLLAKYFSNEEK